APKTLPGSSEEEVCGRSRIDSAPHSSEQTGACGTRGQLCAGQRSGRERAPPVSTHHDLSLGDSGRTICGESIARATVCGESSAGATQRRPWERPGEPPALLRVADALDGVDDEVPEPGRIDADGNL